MFEIVFKQESDIYCDDEEKSKLQDFDYDNILTVFDNETSLYDNESYGIFQLKKKMIENSLNTPPNPYSLLNSFFFQIINNPYLNPEDVKKLHEKTGLSERQIRDYFRNKRKRFIQPIQNLLNEDINKFNEKDNDLTKIINDYLVELT